MVYDGLCYMKLNGSQSANFSDPTVTRLLIAEGISISIATALLFVTVLHMILVKPDSFLKIQINICSMLLLSHILIGLGFLITPCEPLEFQSPESFIVACRIVSSLQFIFVTSSFNWKAVEVCFLGHLVAQKCIMEAQRRVTRFKVTKSAKNRLQRTFSRDIIFDRSTLGRASRAEKGPNKACNNAENREISWFIKFFAKNPPNFGWFLFFGYFPAAFLMALSYSSYHKEEEPLEGGLQDWMERNGLDIYCWPGTKSKMIYYMTGGILFSTMMTFYFFFESSSLVRDWKRGAFSPEFRDPHSIVYMMKNKIELEKHIESEVVQLRSSMMIMVIMFATWLIGTLQTVLAWGLAIPFGILCLLEGLVYFLLHVVKIYSKICAKDVDENAENP